MISDTEKRRFLESLRDAAVEKNPNHKSLGVLLAIIDDYSGDDNDIDHMKPWFISQIDQGKTVADLMEMCDAPRHRILFALTKLGLRAPGMQA